jgi:hypothetical protein
MTQYTIRFLVSLALPLALSAQTNVLTQHNDIGRTGQNLTETILTPANVSASNSFGKLYTANLDGRAFAQPLYVSSVTIGGVNHSVVYMATEHDSVYALDANANGAILWKASLMDQAHGAAAGAIPDPQSDTGCGDIDGAEYGITGTPVINYTNAATGTLYVVSETEEGSYPVQRLHALDMTTGAEQKGSPVVISASVAGTGNGSANGTVSFDPKWDNQRPGLLFLNGTVYMGWGSHCDSGPWHGWVMGYNGSTLQQSFVFLTSPNGASSGVWMSGAGLAADTHGASGTLANGKGTAPRLFIATGNGSFDSNGDWGESVLNLNPTGGTPVVTDSFTPDTQAELTTGDIDLGSAGTLILPDQPSTTYPHLAVQLSKSGQLYLLNRDHLGGYDASADQVLQEFAFGPNQLGLWGIPAYFNGSIYFWGANSNLQQYTLGTSQTGVPSLSLASQGSYTEPGAGGGYYVGTFQGASPSISANGTSNGIVWVNDWVRDQGNIIQYLYAYPASNVTTPLWTSLQNPARDGAGGSQKQGVPTVADGKVFMASDSQLQVYGLLPASFASYNLAAFQPVLSVLPGSSASTQVNVTPVGSFTGAVTLTASGLPTGVTSAFSASGNGGALLTLTAASGTAVTTAPATVTITGTSGAMSQSITVSLSVSNTPGPVAVNLAPVANVYGSVLNNSTPANGGFDTESWAYSANLLGPSLSALGVPFYFGTPGSANAVSNITVPLPAGNFQSLDLAGAAVNGSQASQSFVVTYSDNSTTTFTQSISDWCGPQNYPGETVASTMTYRVSPGSGTVALACNVYAYSFPLNSAKTVSSITLPANRNVAFLAMTLSGQTAAPAPQPQTISFNSIPSQIVGGTLTVSATATSGLPVSFTLVPNGNCSISSNVVTFLNTGNCGVIASQAGNGSYAAAPAVGQIIVVNNPTAQTIAFPAIANQTAGTTLTLTATATSGLSVSYASSTTPVCTLAGSTATLVAAGTCTITASQPGNNVYGAAAPVTHSFTVAASVSTAMRFIPVTPLRLVDTRNATASFGGPAISAGGSRSFVIPTADSAIPSGALAYSLNVTVVPSGALQSLTVYPTGGTAPSFPLLSSDGRIKAQAAIVQAGTGGAITVAASSTTDVIIDVNGYFVPASNTSGLEFYPVTPARLYDTRGGSGFSGGQTKTFAIQSAAGIPATAQAYSLNLTAVPSGSLGDIVVWPSSQAQPNTSTLNTGTNITANAAIVGAGTNGSISVTATGPTDLLIDINGYWAPAGTGGLSLHPLTPVRVYNSGTNISGALTTPAPASSTGIPSSAQAFLLDATITPPASLGHLVLWPGGTSQPNVSTLNANDGAVTSNTAIVGTTNGSIGVFAANPTVLTLDVYGYFAP